MSENRVVLVAEMKDDLSAPISTLDQKIEKSTQKIEKSSKRQAKSTTDSTGTQISAMDKAGKKAGTMGGLFTKAEGTSKKGFAGIKAGFAGVGSAAAKGLGGISRATGNAFGGLKSVAGKAFSGLAGMAKGAGQKIGSGIKNGVKGASLAVAALVGTALFKGFGRLSSIENAEASLKGLGHSAGTVKGIMGDALKSVKGTAFGMDEAAKTAAGSVAAGIKPGEDLEKVLRLTADAATIGGSSMGEMGAIFNKVATSNKIQGDTIAQLNDKGIPIVQLLGKQLGKTGEEVTKLASEGEIDFATFRSAMEDGLGGAALESGSTTTGAFKNMGAALSRVGVALLQDFYPLLGPIFGALTGWLDAATEKLGPIVHVFATELVGGLRAFGAAWKANDGDITSSGFPGFMERIAYIARQAFEEIRGGIIAFGEAWKYNDGEITSSGFPGFMERVGYAAHQVFDYIRETVIPALVSFGGFLMDNKNVLVLIGGVMAAVAIGTRIWAGAQLLLNLALNANPIGLIIIALTALGVGIMLAYNNIGWFKDGVNAAWSGIKTVVSAVVSWFQNTVWPILTTVWDGIAAGATWLWKNVLEPAWQGILTAVSTVVSWFTNTALPVIQNVFQIIGTVITWLWQNIVKPVFGFIKAYISLEIAVIVGIFNFVVSIVRDVLAPIFTWLWESIIKPVFGFIGWAIGVWWTLVSGIFRLAVGFVQNVLGPIFTWLWDSIIKPVFGWIGDLIGLWWTFTVKPVLDAVVWFLKDVLGPVFKWLYDKVIKPVFGWIGTKISDVWTGKIKPVFDAMMWIIKNVIPEAFSKGASAVGAAWDKVKRFVAIPIEFVIDTVINKGIIGAFNWIAKKLGVDKIDPVAMPPGLSGGGATTKGISSGGPKRAFYDGGYTGDGGKYEKKGDVHGGEFVFTKAQTAAMGKGNLAAMAHNAIRGGGAPSLAPGAGNMGGFFHGSANAIARHGAYYLDVPSSMNAWNFPGAAKMWDGAAGVKVKTGRGQLQGHASNLERGGQIVGYTLGTNIDMSPSWMARLGGKDRRTVAAHEIGHALGLPHNGLSSIMQPNLNQMASGPTPLDIRNLQSLYPGGSGKAGEGGGGWGILSWLTDKFTDLTNMITKIPGVGGFTDLAAGVGKTLLAGVKDFALSKLPGGIFDGGGILQSGGVGVNLSGKPERVLSPQQTSSFDELVSTYRNGVTPGTTISVGKIEISVQMTDGGDVDWDDFKEKVAGVFEELERRAY